MAAQVVAVVIFLVMFGLIISDKFERHVITLLCALATLVIVFGLFMHSLSAIWETLGIQNIFTPGFWYAAFRAESASSGINWATIIFIAGMMIMVEGMAEAGFFRWLCITIARAVQYKVIPIFFTFMFMAAILSMFIDSITVILFLAAVTVELAQLLKFDPVPMILSEIFCANLGGSATMCGDPPNIIMGTSLGFTFNDFILNTGLMAGVSMIAVVIYFFLVFKKELEQEQAGEDLSVHPDPSEAIHDIRSFRISSLIFFCAVILLVTHAKTGLTVATIGVFIAALTLLTAGKKAPLLLKKVDYKTLLFFIGLFVVVGGLEKTGFLQIVADLIGKVSGGNAIVMIAIIMWVSAILSAFIDNIPFVATMLPVIRALSASSGVDLSVLAWALSIGTDVGGSATPIGASANVVGTSIAARSGYPIGWGRYCKTAVAATCIVLIISMLIMYVRYF